MIRTAILYCTRYTCIIEFRNDAHGLLTIPPSPSFQVKFALLSQITDMILRTEGLALSVPHRPRLSDLPLASDLNSPRPEHVLESDLLSVSLSSFLTLPSNTLR